LKERGKKTNALRPRPPYATVCSMSIWETQLPEEFHAWLAPFQAYYALLQAQPHNLIRLQDEADFITRHLLNALTLVPHLPATGQVMDIGSGGGVPVLPLALVRPDLTWVAVESVGKKAQVLTAMAAELGVTLTVLNTRSELLGQNAQYRERYDRVTARAVAPLPLLLELTLPLVKPKGQLLALKGQRVGEELADARRALQALGGRARPVETPPLDPETRLLRVDKVRPTPKQYPRFPIKAPLNNL
jgi:16S rRNA (guanine527-N7)-methyltransferase